MMALTTEDQLWMARHERAAMLEDFLFVERVNDRLIDFLVRPHRDGAGFVVRLTERIGGYLGGDLLRDDLYRFAHREQAIEAVYLATGIRGDDGLLSP